jgi:hypothetical protein
MVTSATTWCQKMLPRRHFLLRHWQSTVWTEVDPIISLSLILTTRILRIQKWVIRSMVGVSGRTSCRQLFKEMNILTLVSLYIMEVICYIRKHHQFVDLNSNVHAHITWRKMDIHIQSYNTDLYKRSVINMGTKLYNKLPGYIKEIDSYKTFKKKLKSLLLLHSFYSVEEFVAL